MVDRRVRHAAKPLAGQEDQAFRLIDGRRSGSRDADLDAERSGRHGFSRAGARRALAGLRLRVRAALTAVPRRAVAAACFGGGAGSTFSSRRTWNSSSPSALMFAK